MQQRASLLNRILADLYGNQQILREGLIPPELVYSNPGFLRPCHGVSVPHDVFLHLYAADLARGPDGQWRVLADRTQAPSGAGYTLENRIVLSRVFPDLFRESQVRRLATFFRDQREMLMGLASARHELPRIVLLTPGPYNETYFEHVYLARYLGLTLVEGADLMVRDRRVYLKTLDGLQPVDVILRRVDDQFCDPLEFLSESFLGVSGLMEAVRAGTVAVVNALGSGVIETPALLPFLPKLCRHFLNQDLKIPSMPTLWCLSEDSPDLILGKSERFVIKPAFPGAGMEPVFLATLSEAEQSRWITRLRAQPTRYVIQETLVLSRAPIWGPGGLEPRPMVLRANLTWTADSYQVLPGGLTRFSNSPETTVVSMQRGGGSKDTWVLSEKPVEPFSLLNPSGQPVQLKRSAGDLPSRVADNLFWLGRYAERSEGETRLLRSILDRLVDVSRHVSPEQVHLFFRLVSRLWYLDAEILLHGEAIALKNLEQELLGTIFDEKKPFSLQSTLQELHRVAGSVRDRLSFDTVRILNQLASRPKSRASLQITESISVLNRWIFAFAAFRGMERENMTRGQGWHFLHMGRRLERALYLTRLFRSLMVTADSD
ncbi:MAG: circularly permuted type 2 ATP-grasp protein, partial [Terriglobia bacterium]